MIRTLKTEASEETATDYKQLACAVIFRALEDLQHPGAMAKNRTEMQKNLESAKEFCLTDNEDLAFWASLSDFPAKAIQETGFKIIRGELDVQKMKTSLLLSWKTRTATEQTSQQE